MNKLSSLILVFIAAFVLVGCAQPTVTKYSYQKKGDVNLVSVSYAIVDKLENNLKTPISPDNPIIVASFVDINDLKASSPFGRMIAEQVGSRFAQKGYKVIEMKLRQNSVFVEEGRGEFLLSRDLKLISLNHDASAVVVGTYACSRDKIYVSSRIVNPEDSVILSSIDYGIPAGPMLQKSLMNK
jgi:TolB-like protein